MQSEPYQTLTSEPTDIYSSGLETWHKVRLFLSAYLLLCITLFMFKFVSTARGPVQRTELRPHHRQARLLLANNYVPWTRHSGLRSFLRMSLGLSLVATMAECVYAALEIKGVRTSVYIKPLSEDIDHGCSFWPES
ncbi:hypothetical protein PoB_005210500 [Plakobranchus ocellatus]|uniref:Uncharacterized protein n=1 Tax=Plakobranchus ocellatus TaxID=259542 RepID=A0AAV4BYW1_9GAST|nr:hypothetical protein PoB_005210500 [Plakobranchus ocellatus]